MKLVEGFNPMTGTKNRSIQKWNEAKLKIVHSKPVDEDVRGARSRNIKKLFIETNEGERFKFPVIHLEGARAMARHIGAGGTIHDKVGKYIIDLAEEFNDLRAISSHVYRNKSTLSESAFDLRETARSRMGEIRESLKNFMSKRSYISACNEAEAHENTLNETIDNIGEIKSILNLDEDHDLNLNRLSGLLNERTPEEVKPSDEESDKNLQARFTKETIRKAMGDRDFDSNRDRRDMEKELEAAAEIMNTKNFVWLDKLPSSEQTKPYNMTSLARLRWRLGALSERLNPTVPGQVVLSNILANIADKLDNPNAKGKVPVNVAEKEMVDEFIKIAPIIGEQRNEKRVDQENVMNEFKEITEWFESFDIKNIFKEEKKEEPKNKKPKNKEEKMKKNLSEKEIFDRYFFIADSLARGLRSPEEVKKKFNENHILGIAYVLNENWTSETTESIISTFGLNQEQLDEYSIEKRFGGSNSKKQFGRKPSSMKAAMSHGDIPDDDEDGDYVVPSQKMFHPKDKDRMAPGAKEFLRDDETDEDTPIKNVKENNVQSMRKILTIFENDIEDQEKLDEWFDTGSWVKGKYDQAIGKFLLKPESRKKIEDMLSQGMTVREVARVCGIDTRAMRRIIDAAGVTLPESEDPKITQDKKGDFEDDIDPDNPESKRFANRINNDKEAIKRQENY